ncbi:MAG: alpha-hydroxy-acid oxidizing protein, partial [Sediminibacterium sp.]|nr:alpha-hydroxy-acid oxidizing protein [Sediminibacterium sp.]
RMTLKNILQILGKPNWALQTLYHGTPSFATMQPYMPAGLNMQQLGQFMNKTFSGRLNEQKIAAIRDKWKGKLVIKGIASEEDAEKAIQLGLDGIIVSNHGGRQLDAAQSSIQSLLPIVEKFSDKITIMMDSGIRTGPDIARTLASGAAFSFLGRSFMYAVAALGNEGAHHMISSLQIQLKQVMDQIGCSQVTDLPAFAVRKK